MIYYYKTTDADNNVISLLTCNVRLTGSETQKEITEKEYAELHADLDARRSKPLDKEVTI